MRSLRPMALVAALVCLAPAGAAAQVVDLVPTEDETTAWQLYQLERYVGAREVVEDVLERDRRSIIGNAVLGMIQRYGEGNLPRSLYNLRHARTLLEARFGEAPAGPSAAEWHERIIEETAYTAAEMERFEEELELWDLRDRLYDPDVPGERIWPLMMLRRFDEARLWAARAIATGDRWAYRQAMNGLCALENEAGNRSESYRWCTTHAQEIQSIPGFGGVYLCNAGEAARGLFRLDEAERYYLDAARREVEWYANPWMDVAGLYVRAGRLTSAAQAVQSMHEYARRRPPHTQQQDQSERNRTVAALLVVVGRPATALPLTERAVRYPDRRGGQSRSPEADLSTNALLNRRVLLDAAEVEVERSSTGGLWERAAGWLRASWLRARALRSARRVVALMADPDLLRGLLEAEGRDSFGTPPWLTPDLVDVVGPGPVEASLDAAMAEADPDVPALRAYLAAYGAEAAAARGDWDRARDLATRADADLPAGEALLRARALLVLARVLEARDQPGPAALRYLEALRLDPTMLRRTGRRLPVRIESARDRLSLRTAALLRRSPRLRQEPRSTLAIQVQADGAGACDVCLATGASTTESCATATIERGTPREAAARACAALVHERLLAPQVDEALFEPSLLDGTAQRPSSVDLLPGFDR